MGNVAQWEKYAVRNHTPYVKMRIKRRDYEM